MFTMNLSSLESPHLICSNDDEYSQDFNTEIDYEDEILNDYADEKFNSSELFMDSLDDDFYNYSQEMKLSLEYSYDTEDSEYDEFSISTDQIMLEDAADS